MNLISNSSVLSKFVTNFFTPQFLTTINGSQVKIFTWRNGFLQNPKADWSELQQDDFNNRNSPSSDSFGVFLLGIHFFFYNPLFLSKSDI